MIIGQSHIFLSKVTNQSLYECVGRFRSSAAITDIVIIEEIEQSV